MIHLGFLVKQNPNLRYLFLWILLTLISSGLPSFICESFIGLFKLYLRYFVIGSSEMSLVRIGSISSPICPIYNHFSWSLSFLMVHPLVFGLFKLISKPYHSLSWLRSWFMLGSLDSHVHQSIQSVHSSISFMFISKQFKVTNVIQFILCSFHFQDVHIHTRLQELVNFVTFDF